MAVESKGPSGEPPKRQSIGRLLRKKKALQPSILMNLSNCKYGVVRKAQRTLSWKEVADEDGTWHVYWTDTSIGADRLLRLEPYQKINHFYGMLEVCRKKALSRNFAAMKKLAAAEYDYMPTSFIIPRELSEFLTQLNKKSVRTYILKPDSGCQGRGIALVQNEAGVFDAIRNLPTETLVAQKYLTKPMLVNDFKFDLRIYVLVLSCDPLRVFLYKEGLARFCTEKYVAPQRNNLGQACMHLTNYAVNKRNEKFAFNKDAAASDEGSKWSLTSMLAALRKKGHDVDKLWEQIADLTCKTLISIQPLLAHNYRTCIPDVRDPFSCFELLGLDVILDHKCKPWLLEVNHSPSFTTDTPLDARIKEALILETLNLVHVDPQKIQAFQEGEKKGALSRLYNRRRSSAKENTPLERGPLVRGKVGGRVEPLTDSAGMVPDLRRIRPEPTKENTHLDTGPQAVRGNIGGRAEPPKAVAMVPEPAEMVPESRRNLSEACRDLAESCRILSESCRKLPDLTGESGERDEKTVPELLHELRDEVSQSVGGYTLTRDATSIEVEITESDTCSSDALELGLVSVSEGSASKVPPVNCKGAASTSCELAEGGVLDRALESPDAQTGPVSVTTEAVSVKERNSGSINGKKGSVAAETESASFDTGTVGIDEGLHPTKPESVNDESGPVNGPELESNVGNPTDSGDDEAARHRKETEVLMEARKAYEDETMVLYERILPSSDPGLAAKYERLQQAAEAMFQAHLEVKVRKRIAQVLEERRQLEQEELERAAKPARKTVEQLKRLLKPRGLVRKPDPRLERPTYRFSQVEVGGVDGDWLEESHVSINEWLGAQGLERKKGSEYDGVGSRRAADVGPGNTDVSSKDADVGDWFGGLSGHVNKRGSDVSGRPPSGRRESFGVEAPRSNRADVSIAIKEDVRNSKPDDVSDLCADDVSRSRKPGRLSLPILKCGSVPRGDAYVSSCKVDDRSGQMSLSDLIASVSKSARGPTTHSSAEATKRVEWEALSRRKGSRRATGSSRVQPVISLESGDEVVRVANQVSLIAKGLKLHEIKPFASRRLSSL